MSSFYKNVCVLRASMRKGVWKLTSFRRACVLGGMWDDLLFWGGRYNVWFTSDEFSKVQLPLSSLDMVCP